MKILVIFTLYLISGRIDCVDVIGYSGGSVIIHSDILWDFKIDKNICKVNNNKRGCTDIIRSNTKNSSVQEGRFTLYKDHNEHLSVLISRLKPEDAGEYKIGLQNEKKHNLTVHNDACCGEPKAMNIYLGQNSSFICDFPADNRFNFKYIYKLDNETTVKEVLGTFTKPQNGRFSISNDSKSRVIVNISDVRETDEGVYLCGVRSKSDTVTYYTFFQEIQLHVTATLTAIPSDAANFSSSVIIIMCVCVTLLLAGGFAVIFYILSCRKTQGSTHSSMVINDNNQIPSADNVHEVKPTNSESATASGNNPDRQTCFTEQPEKEEDLKYATVSYLKNPDDATVTFIKEKSATEYATVRYPTLE